MKVPTNLRYLETHEWAKEEAGLFVCGITDYAQEELSDIVFVELPEVGKEVKKGAPLCVVESVKAASDIYAPVSGIVQEVNQALSSEPEKVNQDPYGEGWLCKIEPVSTQEFETLLSPQAYEKHVTAL